MDPPGIFECLLINLAVTETIKTQYDSATKIMSGLEDCCNTFKQRISHSIRRTQRSIARVLDGGRYQLSLCDAIEESEFLFMNTQNKSNDKSIDATVSRVYNLHGEAAGVYDYCRRDSEHPMTVKQIAKTYDIPQAKLRAAVDRRNYNRRAFAQYTEMQRERMANYIDNAITREMTVSEMVTEIANGETSVAWLNERGASASTLYRTMKQHHILTPMQQGIDRRRKESIKLEQIAA